VKGRTFSFCDPYDPYDAYALCTPNFCFVTPMTPMTPMLCVRQIFVLSPL
jgi:hypothetical protein